MTLQFKVPSMVCDGCANAVKAAIAELDAGARVDINLDTKAVSAETSASMDAVRAAVSDCGHTVE